MSLFWFFLLYIHPSVFPFISFSASNSVSQYFSLCSPSLCLFFFIYFSLSLSFSFFSPLTHFLNISFCVFPSLCHLSLFPSPFSSFRFSPYLYFSFYLSVFLFSFSSSFSLSVFLSLLVFSLYLSLYCSSFHCVPPLSHCVILFHSLSLALSFLSSLINFQSLSYFLSFPLSLLLGLPMLHVTFSLPHALSFHIFPFPLQSLCPLS